MTWPRGKLLPHDLHTKLSLRKTTTLQHWEEASFQGYCCSDTSSSSTFRWPHGGNWSTRIKQEKASLITVSQSHWTWSVVDILEKILQVMWYKTSTHTSTRGDPAWVRGEQGWHGSPHGWWEWHLYHDLCQLWAPLWMQAVGNWEGWPSWDIIKALEPFNLRKRPGSSL